MQTIDQKHPSPAEVDPGRDTYDSTPGVKQQRVTKAAWEAEAVRRFGEKARNWKFVCPCCGHVASLADWKALGAGEGEMAFSCIGRRMPNARDAFDKTKPGPCNYAGGGLFRMNPVTVVFDGLERQTFAFAEAP